MEGERLTLVTRETPPEAVHAPHLHHHQHCLPPRQTSPGPVCMPVLAPVTPPTTPLHLCTWQRRSAWRKNRKIAAGRFIFKMFLLRLTDRFRSDSNFKIPTGFAVKWRWRRLLQRGELHYPSVPLMSSRRYC